MCCGLLKALENPEVLHFKRCRHSYVLLRDTRAKARICHHDTVNLVAASLRRPHRPALRAVPLRWHQTHSYRVAAPPVGIVRRGRRGLRRPRTPGTLSAAGG